MRLYPLNCCDADCEAVHGCVAGGYQCSVCGGWFCKLDLYYRDGQWFCDDCYSAKQESYNED